MAIATNHWELSVGMLDNGNQAFTKEFELVGADYAAAAANAVALVSDLSGVTECEITGYRLVEVFIEDTVVIPTSLIAEKQLNARVSLQLATSPLKKATHDIPGPKDALFVGAPGTANYNVVKTDAALLLAYFENFETAQTATLSDGENVHATAAIIRGRRVHRSSSLNSPG